MINIINKWCIKLEHEIKKKNKDIFLLVQNIHCLKVRVGANRVPALVMHVQIPAERMVVQRVAECGGFSERKISSMVTARNADFRECGLVSCGM